MNFIIVNKNLIKVDLINDDMKAKFGGRVHVLDKGRIKVLSKLNLGEVSLIVHAHIHKFRDLRKDVTYQRVFDWRAEGLFSFYNSIVDVFRNISEIPSNINDILCMCVTILTNVNSFVDLTKKTLDFSSLCLEVITYINMLIDLQDRCLELKKSGLTFRSVLYFVSLFVGMYNIIKHFIRGDYEPLSISSFTCALGTAFSSVKNKLYKAESAITSLAFVAILEQFLPIHLRKLITKMPLYTRDKILDDSSFVEKILMWISDLPVQIAQCCYAPKSFVENMQYLSQCLPFSRASYFKNTMSDYLSQVTLNKNLIYKPDFQQEYLNFYKEMDTWKTQLLLDHGKLPFAFKDIYDKNVAIYRKIMYNRDTTRVEPVFCVFYGPPGTGKTTLMLKLIESLKQKNSVYSHVSHGQEKDFYDQYDSEDIVMIDDIGQKGVHQWADMINMVSTAQCTLNCAVAENKDMKRFVSRLILATTNKIELRITPVDQISDVEALYRRIQLFDFSKVKFVDGVFSGDVWIKRRCMEGTPSWREVKKFSVGNFMPETIKFIVEETNKRKANVPNRNVELFEVPYLAEGASSSVPDVDHGILIHRPANYDEHQFFHSQYGRPFMPKLYRKRTRFEATIQIFKSFLEAICSVFKDVSGEDVFIFVCIVIFYILLWYIFSRLIPNEEVKIEKKKKFYFANKKEVPDFNFWRPEGDVAPLFLNGSSPNLTLSSISKNVCVVCMFQDDSLVATASAVFSGRFFTTVRHNILDMSKPIYVKVYDKPDNVCYDMVKAHIVYHSDIDDLVICKFDDTVPVRFRHIPLVKKSANLDLYLISAQSCNVVGKLTKFNMTSGYTAITGFVNALEEDDIIYKVRGPGLCGSWCVNADGYIYGHHVAGSVAEGTGIAKCFSKRTFDAIHSFMSTRTPVINVSDKRFGNAGFVVDYEVDIHNVKSSTIVPSEVHGIFPILRAPSNMFSQGVETVKNLMLPTLVETPKPIIAAVEWSAKYMESFCIPEFNQVSELDAIIGYRDMHMLDLKTSAGYGFGGVKGDYIDAHGNMNQRLSDRVHQVEDSMKRGMFAYDTYHKACPKDELRNLSKVDKPRIFCAAPLDVVVLQRKYFSDLLCKLHEDKYKWRSGVMVGINPFSDDWQELYDFITSKGDNCFGGDVSSWDKSMNPVIQNALNEIIYSKFNGDGDSKKVVKYLLQMLVTTPHVNTDVAYIDTHSLASGVVLTADYNSLINKFLSLYSFYIIFRDTFNKAPSFSDYDNALNFVAYGDDSLVGVAPHAFYYSPTNIAKVYKSLNMDFTPEDKGEWTRDFRSIMECTFLKRGFRFHHDIGRVVAPLEKLSMHSTLNFVKDDFRNRELTIIKLLNFQREAYLHVDYSAQMQHLGDYIDINHRYLAKFLKFYDEDYLLSQYNAGAFSDLLELH